MTLSSQVQEHMYFGTTFNRDSSERRNSDNLLSVQFPRYLDNYSTPVVSALTFK
jgi:hypothetical protein